MRSKSGDLELVFKECLVTKDTWRQLNCAWPELVEEASFIDWITWFSKTILLVSVKSLHVQFGIVDRKDKWIHERQKKSRLEIANFVRSYIIELDGLEKVLPANLLGNESWKPPKSPFARINFDIAYNKKDNRSCSGLVVRDSNVMVLVARTVLNDNVLFVLQQWLLPVFRDSN
ncbi:hypothetical protein CXB51_003348 [Gossypium anomalum]|uniref:Uncharacterized protein n=1 Tax=Gossypium anomalum TaxID=47600 RepID=A0A8J5ZIQ5_9ROSI|nr:hypothetical protein CXB51_003348 [Gossypium anomalum]